MKHSFNFIENYPLNSLKGLKHFFFKALRIMYLTAKNFTEDKCLTTSSSLTYYTLMALMPIIAIILGIAKTIGYNKLVEQEILQKFPEHHKLIFEFIDISNNFLQKMDVDIIAISSVIVLLLAVIVALSHLVSYFNSIWDVNKRRKIKTRYFIYCSLILSILIYFLISIFLNFILAKKLTFLIHKDYVYFIIGLISFILLISLLTFIYKFIPHTKVKFKSAFVGAFFGGILYILWQWIYVKFQVGVNRYDLIYGSLAFIPIFLIWLKFSWLIVLLGSEISYAYQNIEDCEFKNEAAHLSQNYITVLSIWFLKEIVERKLVDKIITKNFLLKTIKWPPSIQYKILNSLVDANILNIIFQKDCYILSFKRDFNILKIQDVDFSLKNYGINKLEKIDNLEINKIRDVYQDLYENMHELDSNMFLKDIIL